MIVQHGYITGQARYGLLVRPVLKTEVKIPTRIENAPGFGMIHREIGQGFGTAKTLLVLKDVAFGELLGTSGPKAQDGYGDR
jgi:hypothetical protein